MCRPFTFPHGQWETIKFIHTADFYRRFSDDGGNHKEVKTASFQGKSITVENLTPMLSPRARDKRKREIESCLYEVFVKYAPGRAQMH